MREVTLYIPCYNSGKTIQSCLEAVFRQTYPIKEIFIVDDGSSDETVEIASRYPLRLIRHPCNKGLSAARNTAVKSADTEFIASLDADCLPDKNWLKCLMQRFTSSRIAGAGGKLLETYSSTVFDLWRSLRMKQYWEKGNTAPLFLFGSNTVFRRDSLINIGLYKEEFKNNYEDVDICERLKKKRHALVYEPRAIAHHFKCDDLYSVLDTYWKWNSAFYQKSKYYSNQKNLIFKLKDNLGLAYRYIEEDINCGRYQLVYLDFFLALHHSLKDLEYYIYRNSSVKLEYPILSSWLSLLDLVFFYHFDSTREEFSTLVLKANKHLGVILALNLITGEYVRQVFKNRDFQRILHKHLLMSIYKINDPCMVDKLLDLTELHFDWSGLFKKSHPYLDAAVLKSLFLNFRRLLEMLMLRFENIIQIIEVSAEKTDKLPVF